MKRRIRMLVLAAVLLAVAVPVGTALTLERRHLPAAPVAMQSTVVLEASHRPLSEPGVLLLTGGLLIALAGMVRRAW